MPNILAEYFKALGRLKKGKPINVPKGTRISNDSVSLEAGRKKGTIKKSRPIFSELIEAIEAAARLELRPQDETRTKLDDAKNEVDRYRTLWEEALAREVSLVRQLWDERECWQRERAALTGDKIIPIRSGKYGYEK